MNWLFSDVITSNNFHDFLQFMQFFVTAVIGYFMWRQTHATSGNSDKLDNVIKQTDGMSDHLVKLQAIVSHADGKAEGKIEGKADEKADQAMRESRAVPIDLRTDANDSMLMGGKPDEDKIRRS